MQPAFTIHNSHLFRFVVLYHKLAIIYFHVIIQWFAFVTAYLLVNISPIILASYSIHYRSFISFVLFARIFHQVIYDSREKNQSISNHVIQQDFHKNDFRSNREIYLCRMFEKHYIKEFLQYVRHISGSRNYIKE